MDLDRRDSQLLLPLAGMGSVLSLALALYWFLFNTTRTTTVRTFYGTALLSVSVNGVMGIRAWLRRSRRAQAHFIGSGLVAVIAPPGIAVMPMFLTAAVLGRRPQRSDDRPGANGSLRSVVAVSLATIGSVGSLVLALWIAFATEPSDGLDRWAYFGALIMIAASGIVGVWVRGRLPRRAIHHFLASGLIVLFVPMGILLSPVFLAAALVLWMGRNSSGVNESHSD